MQSSLSPSSGNSGPDGGGCSDGGGVRAPLYVWLPRSRGSSVPKLYPSRAGEPPRGGEPASAERAIALARRAAELYDGRVGGRMSLLPRASARLVFDGWGWGAGLTPRLPFSGAQCPIRLPYRTRPLAWGLPLGGRAGRSEGPSPAKAGCAPQGAPSTTARHKQLMIARLSNGAPPSPGA